MIEWKTSNQAIDYQDAVELMEKRVEQIHQGKASELIWFLEHPSIYTAGSSAEDNELMNPNGLPVYNTGRGGKYTYHGPGQRIIYLMLDLKDRGKDLRKFVATIEDWVIASLREIGIVAEKKEGRIGIWTVNNRQKELKIAAIGIRVRKWVTYHGVSINISPDLDYYKGIIACGIREYGVTSFKDLGFNISSIDIDNILKRKFYDFF
ncbi:MAG: lipoyl(octanoyl) transferase LipB [Pseudomonadota bacterium]